MGLLDNNNIGTYSIFPPAKDGIETLFASDDVLIKMHKFTDKEIVAVLNDVVVWSKPAVNASNKALYISTDGFGGSLSEVKFNSTNFPNLIDGSNIRHCAILPYARRNSDTVETFDGKDWRLVVFTDKGQIYHNFPSRASGYDGVSQDGDMLKFDESVVWDLPDRKTPVKTTIGNDATLIATGCYRYMPCLPDAMYEMHPAISSDNGYGNGGFPSIYEYNDRLDGNISKKRPRLFYPKINNNNANLFSWMSGFVQDKQVSMFGTYMPNDVDTGCRMCVFASSDGGRQWFVVYEFGANGERIGTNDSNVEFKITNPILNFSEYGDASNNQIVWGTNQMSNPSEFAVIRRSQWTPTTSHKEPEHKFKYGNEIAVSSIVSSPANGIVVTTSNAHGLINGDVVIFKKESETANDWDWLAANDYTQDDAGNGVIWKAKVLTTTTFKLMLEVHNPYNELGIRHIHSINRYKDGYTVSCGEEYPLGWVMCIESINVDTHAFLNAAYKRNVYRLTSTPISIQRCLGVEILDDLDNTVFAGLDTAVIPRKGVKPSGRTEALQRNSCGIFKMGINDVDDFDNAECVFQLSQPTYFFKIIQGVMLAIGQQNMMGISFDYGKSWITYQLPVYTNPAFYALAEWIGTTSKKEICIKRYTWANTLIICPKK